jgi:hypothetical protein
MMLSLTAVLLLQSPTPEELIERLRSDRVEIRDAALKELKRGGNSSIPALEKAVKDPDVELASRAQEVIRIFKAEACAATFQEMSQDLLKSRSARVQFRSRASVTRLREAETLECSGEIWSQEGGKLYLRSSVAVNDRRRTFLMVSNGTRTVTHWSQCAMDHSETRIGLTHQVKVALSQMGPTFLTLLISGAPLGNGLNSFVDPQRFEQQAEISYGGEEGRMAILTYATRSLQGAGALKGALWYDPLNRRVYRRRLSGFADRTEAGTDFTEHFDEFSLNVDIPDEKFTLPEKGD